MSHQTEKISLNPRELINNVQFILFLFILFLAFVGSKLILSLDYNKIIFLFGPFVFLFFLIKNVKALIVFFILVCYVNYFIYFYNLPLFLTWYVEFYVLALLLAAAGYLIRNREKISSWNLFLFPLGTILLSHLISFYLNKQNLFQFLMASRKYYTYLILFLSIILLPVTKEFNERLIRVMMFTIFIQIPISIFQYFIFDRADFMGGLFGKNSSGPISTLGIGFGFFGYYLYKYYVNNKIFLLACIGMIIPLIVAESKFAMIILPLAYVYNFVVERKKYLKKILILLGMIPLFIIILLAFDYINSHNPAYYPYMQWTLKDPLYMIKQAARIPSGIEEPTELGAYSLPTYDRLASIPFVFNYIKENTMAFLFGFGPGEAQQDLYFQGRLVNLGINPTFLVVALLEWGIVGTGAWMLLFSYLFIINFKCLRYFHRNPTNSLWKAFCYFSNMQMFVFIFDIIYSRSFILDYHGLFFWIINGLMVWYYRNHVVERIT